MPSLGERFEIDHQAAIAIGGEKKRNFAAEAGARGGIVEEVGDGGAKVVAIEILHDGEDFHVGVFGVEEGHDFVVDGTDFLIVDDVEHGVGFRIDGLQVAVGAQNLQPGWKQ